MRHPLYIALLWHMHQPDYSDPQTGEAIVPWVRLHAAKDYLRMAEILRQYPKVRATFNFVPSLLDQIQAYAAGTATDQALAVSAKTDWTRQEKEYLLSFFLGGSQQRTLGNSARYLELKARRDATGCDPDAFHQADYLDIIALFNLAWLDTGASPPGDELRSMMYKGAGFSAEDIGRILAGQQHAIERVIPAYRTLSEQGQVELATSPYYHPILPLLLSTDLAARPSPYLSLPTPAFSAPEDAREHLARAADAHAARFGQKPAGLWPPEGAVSAEVASLAAEMGFRWIASDEALLARSLGVRIERDGAGHVTNPAVLYQPYRVTQGRQPLAAIFRDHAQSDRIGFVYQGMDARTAVDDFMHRLHTIGERVGSDELPYLVAVILDGENAWEYYDQNGNPFLHSLYQRLSEDPLVETVTVSQYLERHPPRASIERLCTGSWINGNLDTWIGEPAHNRAWGQLRRARERLAAWKQETPEVPREVVERAWEEIYRAEGSDWFWWYSVRNSAQEESLFDGLFRARLQKVYRLMGETPPDDLSREQADGDVSRMAIPLLARPAAEWSSAALWEQALTVSPAAASLGATQRASVPVRHLRAFWDLEQLHLRLETYEPLDGQSLVVEIWPDGDTEREPLRIHLAGDGTLAEESAVLAHRDVDWAALAVPLAVLGANRLGDIAMRAALAQATGERCWVPSEIPGRFRLVDPES